MNKTQPALEDLFMTVHQKLGASLRRESKTLDYTLSQLEVLRFVVENRNPTMKDIAAYLQVTAPSATAIVEQLHARKLVIRKADPKDRREVRVYPTSKTVQLFSKFKSIKVSLFSKTLKPLNTTDRKQLAAILTKLL